MENRIKCKSPKNLNGVTKGTISKSELIVPRNKSLNDLRIKLLSATSKLKFGLCVRNFSSRGVWSKGDCKMLFKVWGNTIWCHTQNSPIFLPATPPPPQFFGYLKHRTSFFIPTSISYFILSQIIGNQDYFLLDLFDSTVCWSIGVHDVTNICGQFGDTDVGEAAFLPFMSPKLWMTSYIFKNFNRL